MINEEPNWSKDLKSESCPSLDKTFYLALTHLDNFVILNIVVNLVLAVTATLGNGMIIAAILRSQNLQTPSYLLITSLAFTDLLVGLVIHPTQSAAYIVFLQKNMQAICAVTNPYKFFFVFLVAISFSMVTCISIDRYLALTLRHRYPIIVTKKRVLLVIVVLWIFALIAASLIIVDSLYDTIFIIGCCASSALLITTCVFYIKSFRALQLYTVQVHAQQPNPLAGNFDVVRYKKTLKTMVVVLACLLLCCVPYISVLTAQIFLGFDKVVALFYAFSLTLLCINSSINPVIYLIRFKDIRDACYQLFSIIRSYMKAY